MPALSTAELTQAVISALEESGASAILVSPAGDHPKRFLVQAQETAFELWVYIWTATHGGGAARPAHEYRIQLTGIRPPLTLNPSGPTILIGYEPVTDAFAGFDISKHMNFTPGSPSIQVPITTIRTATENGMAFSLKGNDEIAIGFRPDQILVYALNALELHRHGANAAIVDLLTRAVTYQPIAENEIQQLPAERQRVVSQVSRLSRDAAFQRRVKVAYEHRCAVTRVQLKLIDAAHILPVGAPGSNDEVNNGLCLSPTYHRAFDRGLVYLDDTLTMKINPSQERDLERLCLNGGLQEFRRFLDIRIALPADRQQWPDLDFIRQANRVRHIE